MVVRIISDRTVTFLIALRASTLLLLPGVPGFMISTPTSSTAPPLPRRPAPRPAGAAPPGVRLIGHETPRPARAEAEAARGRHYHVARASCAPAAAYGPPARMRPVTGRGPVRAFFGQRRTSMMSNEKLSRPLLTGAKSFAPSTKTTSPARSVTCSPASTARSPLTSHWGATPLCQSPRLIIICLSST